MRVKRVTTKGLMDIHDRLLRAFGRRNWWPADSPEEVAVGAILTQNTAWTNVERAISRLKAASCLDWWRLHTMPEAELGELIRPAGYFRVKARRLKAFAEVLCGSYGGSLLAMLTGELDVVRRRLLDIHGVGPETADSILLYAAGRPSFVVDAYTKRVLRRHGLIADGTDSYEQIRAMFQRRLPADAALYNEFHALIVNLCKGHCRSKARCNGCPLADLPHDETL